MEMNEELEKALALEEEYNDKIQEYDDNILLYEKGFSVSVVKSSLYAIVGLLSSADCVIDAISSAGAFSVLRIVIPTLSFAGTALFGSFAVAENKIIQKLINEKKLLILEHSKKDNREVSVDSKNPLNKHSFKFNGYEKHDTKESNKVKVKRKD